MTVRVASGDPSVLLVAPDASTAGTPFIEIEFLDGIASRPYVLQGVAGATGSVTITASESASRFADATLSVRVVQPVLRLSGLVGTTTSLSVNDPFNVFTFSPNVSGTNVQQFQSLSAAEAPLTVTLTSSEPSVGVLMTDVSGASVMTELQFGGSQTNVPQPQFDPLTGGMTIITATAPGFADGFSTASQQVTVTQP